MATVIAEHDFVRGARKRHCELYGSPGVTVRVEFDLGDSRRALRMLEDAVDSVRWQIAQAVEGEAKDDD